MNTTPTNLMAQDRVTERLAEAQRERLIRSARSSAPRPVAFHASTGSFVGLLVAPVKQFLGSIVHLARHPVSGLGKNATHA